MHWLHTLKVLIWKNFTVRLRRYAFTSIEFSFPMICFLLLFLYKDYINPKPRSFQMNKFNIQNTESMLLNDMEPPTSLYYSPASNYTDTLMEMVTEQLYPKQQNYRDFGRKADAIPISSYNDLLRSNTDLDEKVAVVEFLDIGSNETWPKSVNYTIRMKGKFYTQRTTSDDEEIGPHQSYGTMYKEFMRLQWAIDSSYIKLLTGNDIKQRVWLQEFPFVRPTRIEGKRDVCVIVAGLCWAALLLPFLSLVARLVEERLSGIEGLLKLAGVCMDMLKFSHYINVLPVCLLYCVMIPVMLTSSATPLVVHSSGSLMALFLLLHFNTIVVLAFILSSLLRSRQYVSSIAVYVYVLSWLPVQFVPAGPAGLAGVAGLLPNVPLHWYWLAVAAAEERDEGVTWSSMWRGALPAAVSLSLLLLQLSLLAAVAWLLPAGRWPHALRSWQDFVEECRGSLKVSAQRLPLEEPDEARAAAEYFEHAADDKDVGIRIVNVSKVYNNTAVLKDVSLDVYRGEITVLLGHNGAGKTTLMSIITGMVTPTTGQVFVSGHNALDERRAAQRLVGLCPQHNLFFDHLTVLEHVMMFTMLKGSSYSKAKKSSIALLEQLGIGEKAACDSSELSGGMRRRLQLACALAGDAAVLVLDEPTAGLDVETRRELWNLLLSLRGSRTVLISTHFMEEADALGDRVAALHDGQLRCHATTMHLKRTLGTGYRLSLTTIGPPKEAEITALVAEYVPEAAVRGGGAHALSYSLPARAHAAFPGLFAALETARPRLAIDSIGVGVSTIEEVFLKLCSDSGMRFTEDELDAAGEEPTFNTVSGVRLYVNQTAALFRRQLQFITNKALSYSIMYWVLPFLVALVITVVSNDVAPEEEGTEGSLDLTPGMYRAPAKILYHLADESSLQPVVDGYPGVNFERADDLYNTILDIGRKDIKEYAQYLAAIEVNDTDAMVLYSTVHRHTAPVALSVLSNVVAAGALPWGAARTAAVRNQPLHAGGAAPAAIKQPKSIVGAVLWTTSVVFLTLATMTESLSITIKERVSGTRRIYIMAGCPPEVYWLTSIVGHAVLYGAPLIAGPLLAAAMKDMDHTLVQPDFLGTMALLLFLGVLAYLPLGYLLSFRFGERATAMLLFIIIFIFGLITPAMKAAKETFEGGRPATVRDHVLLALSVSLPPHTLTVAGTRAALAARLNAACALNRGRCPALVIAEPGFDADRCCAMQNPSDYFSTADSSPLWPMIWLLLQSIVFMSVVVLTERGYVKLAWERACNVAYSPPREDLTDVDAMARAERAYVSKAITLPDKQIQEVLLVDDLHKNYPAVCGKGCAAVRGVSFSVKKGECFGLLGVNGAGKSTTFKMLTADEPATRGQIYANGHRLDYRSSVSKYTRSLGYCPQFGGLDSFLSGADNLRLVLTMRGLAPEHVRREADAWINVVGLQKYSGVRARSYSGGCARRLGAAAALAGGARVALLDEPSAGVDVAARRRVWAAVRRALRSQRSLVVSSHSMEEMEALCGRIGIVSGGRVRALGAAAALRAAHAAGHAVLVKLRAQRLGDVTDSAKGLQVQELKSAFHQVFDCTLRDEHTTMLHFHINESISYSILFGALEGLRRDFPELVEDYSVTETTLEEVFLSFAKEAQANV